MRANAAVGGDYDSPCYEQQYQRSLSRLLPRMAFFCGIASDFHHSRMRQCGNLIQTLVVQGLGQLRVGQIGKRHASLWIGPEIGCARPTMAVGVGRSRAAQAANQAVRSPHVYAQYAMHGDTDSKPLLTRPDGAGLLPSCQSHWVSVSCVE